MTAIVPPETPSVKPPAPYYQDDLVTLYHGDCREITAWLEVDVLVTDPPYGRDWQSGQGMTNSSGGGRGSKPHGGILNDKDTLARDVALHMWGTRQALIYAKPMDSGIKGAHAGFRRDVEMVFLVGPWPVAVGGRSSILTTGALVAGPRGLSVRNEHPHAKPLDVLEVLIQATDGTIADPFAGSGSTLMAAKQLGRKAIGVELDERYCEVVAKRLAQDTLFGATA